MSEEDIEYTTTAAEAGMLFIDQVRSNWTVILMTLFSSHIAALIYCVTVYLANALSGYPAYVLLYYFMC